MSVNQVLVFLENKPETLNKLTKVLAANVNIEYMYAFAGKTRAYMIFRVNDTKKAESLLNSKGLKSLTQEEISAV